MRRAFSVGAWVDIAAVLPPASRAVVGVRSAAYRDLVGRPPTPGEARAARRGLTKFERASWALALIHNHRDAADYWARRWHREALNRLPSPGEVGAAALRLSAGEGWDSLRASLFGGEEYVALQRERWRACPDPRTARATLGSMARP